MAIEQHGKLVGELTDRVGRDKGKSQCQIVLAEAVCRETNIFVREE